MRTSNWNGYLTARGVGLQSSCHALNGNPMIGQLHPVIDYYSTYGFGNSRRVHKPQHAHTHLPTCSYRNSQVSLVRPKAAIFR